MAVQPNGTEAKAIALHFMKATEQRATPPIMGKTINQIKEILKHGYTQEEVISVIDYLVYDKKVQLYSFGYISSAINDALREIKKKETQIKANEVKKEMEQHTSEQAKAWDEVFESESSERNREKAGRTDIQSRFREKFNLDMFEGE